MEVVLAKLVTLFGVINSVVEWATINQEAAFFFGMFLWAILNTIVKLSPTKADDIVMDIFVKAIVSAYNAAFKGKLK